MISLHSATLSKAKVAIRIRQSQRWVLGLGKANVAPLQSRGKQSLLINISEKRLQELKDSKDQNPEEDNEAYSEDFEDY